MGLLTLATVLVTSLYPALPKAFADVNGQWNGSSKIVVNGVTYTQCSSKVDTPSQCVRTKAVPSNDFFFPDNWSPSGAVTGGTESSGLKEFCHDPSMKTNGNKYVVGDENGSKTTGQLWKVTGSGDNCLSGPTTIHLSTKNVVIHGSFVNHSTIHLENGTSYTDGKNDDDNGKHNERLNYYSPYNKALDGAAGCADGVIENFSSDHTSATLYDITTVGGLTPSCKKTEAAKVSLSTVKFNSDYAWTSQTSIGPSDGNGTVFVSPQPGGTTLSFNDSSCTVNLSVQSGDWSKDTTGTFSTSGTGCKDKTDGYPSGTINVAAFSSDATAANLNTTGGCSSKDSNGNCLADNDATLSCGGGVLNWIICPVITLAQGAANKVDSFIMNTLDTDVKPIFDQTTVKGTASQGYYTAWNSFRVLATALLIIGGLVMVASQALGFEFLDAYTVRKVLPRLLVAVIGISLSWPLMRLVVSFFDTAGFDIRSLMYAPFKDFGGTLSVSTGLFTSAAVLGAFLAFGFTALTFILTALLGLFVGFIILVIRQIAIIMLIILAPIAIACYILPNTQKVWKLWSENFLGLMLMFPIISALIAAGHIFAAVSLKAGGGDTGTVVAQALAIVAYIAPYFLLPLAARMATGAIGNLAGVVNDRGKGAFDRLKGVRGNAAQKNVAKMKAGNRFSDRNTLSRSFNRTTAGVGTGWNGRFGMGTRGAQAVDQARRNAATEQIMKSAGFAAIQHDDGALMAATYNSAAAARAGLTAKGVDAAEVERSIAAAQASIGFGRSQAIAAGQQLVATGTGYQGYTKANGDKVSALQEMSETIARASGGDKNTAASMAGNMNAETKRAGRFDLAPSFGKLRSLVENEIDGSAPTADKYHEASVRAARGADAVTMLRGKPIQVEQLTKSLGEHARASLAAAQDTTDPTPAGDKRRTEANDEFLRTMGQIDQLNQQKSYASEENQEHVNKLLGDTNDLRGELGVLLGPSGVDPIMLTQAQQQNRSRYNQTRAPRANANDPNLPTE